MERAQKQAILRDLSKKMVFLAGPRQAGKTTLSKEIAKEFSSSVYLTYDRAEDRKIIQQEGWLPSAELLILDEIHKMPKWKSYLKGVYDTKREEQKILVTGSARLEIFNRVGDSLAGRYFLHHLFPLSPAECKKVNFQATLDRFIERGGFPEPFLTTDLVDANRWRNQYVDSLLRTDVLEFDTIHNINAIRMVFELLREKVGSPVSYSSIAEDVAIAPNTVKKYIQILEALYIVFRVTPFSKNIARSLLKEPKIYFFDVGLVQGDAGAKFENLVATCLLKHVYAKVDYQAENYSLKYLQTKEQQEVDFALVQDEQIKKLIEVYRAQDGFLNLGSARRRKIDPNERDHCTPCKASEEGRFYEAVASPNSQNLTERGIKLSNHSIHPGLSYFHKKYDLPSVQIVKDLKRPRVENGIEILDADSFLKELDL